MGHDPSGVSSSRRALSRLFSFYRAALSPLLGPACRFEPSCSHYAEEAVLRFGLGRGSLLALGRVLRCHPFAQGGLDPLPGAPGALSAAAASKASSKAG
jgi:hypothetical protein